MRILCVATKLPWPPRDGGRLALWLTLQGLAENGHEIVLIAPTDRASDLQSGPVLDALRAVCSPRLVLAARRSWLVSLVDALMRKQALTVARHHLVEVEQLVADCVSAWHPEVLHVEQLQALANCGAARAAGIPIVLRMQNVESSLWHQVAMARLRSRVLLPEAHRLRTNEVSAMTTVARVVALTERDAGKLRHIGAMANHDKVVAVCPPFPASLPVGPSATGQPAVVLAGSAGWWPNIEGIRWFLDQVAPLVIAAQPEARIHVYGGARIAGAANQSGVIWHAAPDDAVTAFPDGAIAAIPLHIGSGIRMRILESWARGLPVVATSTAAAGLQVESGRELLIADEPSQFAKAIRDLSQDPDLRKKFIDAGRAYLVTHHDKRLLTLALVAQYQAATSPGRP